MICVYGPECIDFSTNGMGVVTPTSCTVTETLNGEYELQLEPGSKLFLYTDGVPEATDAEGKMFGVDRMLDALNGAKDGTTVDVLKSVRASVDGFVKNAEQFDDLTMLCMEYRGAHGQAKDAAGGNA